MIKKSSVLSNILSLGALQGLNYLLPIITLPYLVRILGVEKFGELAFAQAFIQYFISLTNYGFQVTASRDISIARNNPNDVSYVFWSVTFIKIFLLIVSALILVLLTKLYPSFNDKEAVIYAAALAVVGHVLMPTWLYQGLERMKYLLIVNVIARGAMVPLIFLFVVSKEDITLAAALIASGFALAGFLGFVAAFYVYPIKFVLPSYNMLRKRLKSGWHVFIASIGHVLYSSASVAFILGMLTSSVVVGYFSAAEKVVRAVQGLVLPVSQAVYPYIVSRAKESREEALRFINISLRWNVIVFFTLSLLLLILSPDLVKLILGSEFDKSVPVMRWMAFIPFVAAIGNVFGVQTMLVFNLDKYFSNAYILAATINLCLLLMLVGMYAEIGAAITVLITETFLSSVFFVLLKMKGFRFRLVPLSIL